MSNRPYLAMRNERARKSMCYKLLESISGVPGNISNCPSLAFKILDYLRFYEIIESPKWILSYRVNEESEKMGISAFLYKFKINGSMSASYCNIDVGDMSINYSDDPHISVKEILYGILDLTEQMAMVGKSIPDEIIKDVLGTEASNLIEGYRLNSMIACNRQSRFLSGVTISEE